MLQLRECVYKVTINAPFRRGIFHQWWTPYGESTVRAIVEDIHDGVSATINVVPINLVSFNLSLTPSFKEDQKDESN